MKQDIENTIKKNLPEEKIISNEEFNSIQEDYSGGLLEGEILGHNQCLSQIPVSLIADEVLKVVVGNERKWIEDNWINFYESSKPLADFNKELLRKLNLLSPNKENK